MDLFIVWKGENNMVKMATKQRPKGECGGYLKSLKTIEKKEMKPTSKKDKKK